MRRMLFAGVGLSALLGLGAGAAAQEPGGPPMGGRTMRGGMEKMLEQRFAEMDTNHDGAVTRAEFDAYRAKMRAEREGQRKGHRDREFARLDTNRDGAISRQEFDTPPPPPPGGPMPAPGGNPPLGYDATGGGVPPPPPPGAMAPSAGGPRGAMRGRPGGEGPMGDAWFDRADANHDGKVTLAEAKAAVRAMMSERRGMRGPGGPGPGGDMPPPPPPPPPPQ